MELGYFKAKRQFFSFEPADVADDLRYLLARYFPGKAGAWARRLPGRTTRVLIRQTVLDLLGYQPWDLARLDALHRQWSAQLEHFMTTVKEAGLQEVAEFLAPHLEDMAQRIALISKACPGAGKHP